ncbi:MAG: hypothetical protein E7334_04350 [Clostridiales bacterium]|nr:hypothetical protein [Clostridiales bacterium]
MGRWTIERAWKWYNEKPWIRGCNFMGSDCINRIDQWQEYGFEEKLKTADREFALMESIGYNSIRIIIEYEVWDRQHDGFMERLDRYLACANSHGITAMIVLSNECSVRTPTYVPPVFGEQLWQPGYHGGKDFKTWYQNNGDNRYSILDDPTIAPKYYEMVREIITEYKNDERVLVWNIMNEPGNGRGSKSLPHLKKFFEIGWEIDPIQPLTADVWRGMKDGRPTSEIECFALDNSDVISYHSYQNYYKNVLIIKQLKEYDRPIFNTEWLSRIAGNTLQEMLPLFYLENIGSYNWGFVAGKYQTYEPSQGVWKKYEEQGYDAVKHLDFTKWQHDLYRPGGRFPYDPAEIEIIKELGKLADEKQKALVNFDGDDFA